VRGLRQRNPIFVGHILIKVVGLPVRLTADIDLMQMRICPARARTDCGSRKSGSD
jgi:hypothetical protein